jgi:hypothetical protein
MTAFTVAVAVIALLAGAIHVVHHQDTKTPRGLLVRLVSWCLGGD